MAKAKKGDEPGTSLTCRSLRGQLLNDVRHIDDIQACRIERRRVNVNRFNTEPIRTLIKQRLMQWPSQQCSGFVMGSTGEPATAKRHVVPKRSAACREQFVNNSLPNTR
jgi:hypothetical protein